MRIIHRIAVNAFSSWMTSVVQGILGILLVPFLLVKLGKAGYGLTTIMAVIIGLQELLDLGLRAGLGRNLAEQFARQDQDAYNEFASTAFVGCLVVAAIYLPLLLLFAPWLVRFLNVPPELFSQAVLLLRCYACLSFAMVLVVPVYDAVLTSCNRFDIHNYIYSSFLLVQTVALFVVLSLSAGGLLVWAAVALSAQALKLFVLVVTSHRLFPGLRVNIALASRQAMRKMFSLGSKLFVLQVCYQVALRADTLIIASFWGPAGSAVYDSGQKFPMLLRRVIDSLRNQLSPISTHFHVTGNVEKIQQILVLGTRYTILLAIVPCFTLVALAEPIMKVWVAHTPLGEAYAVAAAVVAGLAMVDFLNYASGSQAAVLLGIDRLNVYVYLQAAAAVVNVIASICLLKYTDVGIAGVVLPHLCTQLLRRPLMLMYTARASGMSSWRYVREAYAGPLCVAMITAAIAVGARLLIDPHSLVALLCCAVSVGLLALPFCWWIGLDNHDRQNMTETLRWFVGKVAARVALPR